jgi:hypothetical protein
MSRVSRSRFSNFCRSRSSHSDAREPTKPGIDQTDPHDPAINDMVLSYCTHYTRDGSRVFLGHANLPLAESDHARGMCLCFWCIVQGIKLCSRYFGVCDKFR